MMKRLSLLMFTLFLGYTGFAQFNTTLVSQMTYNERANDIWGYVAPDGTEYALVGLFGGVSVVSLGDPANPVEIGYAEGAESVWRDLKTWGEYAYVTNESSGGLLIIDLSNLPERIEHTYWAPQMEAFNNEAISSCHNIFIDEFGVAYLAGCNLHNGGVIFLDLNGDPKNPTYLGNGQDVYSHDVYVRDNIMYSSDIYRGSFSVTDVGVKSEPVLLATQGTPSNFTHNTWLSDDSNTIFTTDERGNAPTAAYDISDLSNITELDQFRPTATVGTGVVPHNAHVKDGYLFISHYTDGLVVVDASRPDNLIEVGNYDTFLFPGGSGTNGCWGAYPFLPSGLILVSDIASGLHVLEVEVQHAAFLKGIVTDERTGNAIEGVDVVIDSDEPNYANTRFDGAFKTGQASGGMVNVTFTRFGYNDKTVEVNLVNGELLEIEVELTPRARISVIGQALLTDGVTPIEGVRVQVSSSDITYTTVTDATGTFLLEDIIEGDYTIAAGKWGYESRALDVEALADGIDNRVELAFQLETGYQDDFVLDLGWTVEGNAVSGIWELGAPIATSFSGTLSNIGADLGDDLGDMCYVTGNGGGGAGNDDVDDGNTVLSSPTTDLSNYEDPILTYNTWFFNDGGNTALNDTLQVRISNGLKEVVLENITAQTRAQLPNGTTWAESTINIKEHIELTDNMHIIFETADQIAPGGHLLEAAVDGVKIVDGDGVMSSNEELTEAIRFSSYPNPFSEQLTLQFEPIATNNAVVRIYNTLGQQVTAQSVAQGVSKLQVGATLAPGVYFVQLTIGTQTAYAQRIVKH